MAQLLNDINIFNLTLQKILTNIAAEYRNDTKNQQTFEAIIVHTLYGTIFQFIFSQIINAITYIALHT